MGEQITADNAQGWDLFTRNYVKVRDAFNTTYAQMQARAPLIAQHPELQAEYNKRMAEALKQKATLDQLAAVYAQVKPALDAFVQFSKGAFEWSPFGLVYKGGYQIGTWIKDGLKALGLGEVVYDRETGQQLGVAPIVIAIGLGVATAMVAAVAYFVTDSIKYVQRLDSIQQLQAQGYSADQAAKVVDNQASIQATKDVLSNPFLMIALAGAAAVFLFPKIMKGGGRA